MTASATTVGKMWTWESACIDHVRVLLQYPFVLASPFILTPKQTEALMLSVNSAYKCPYSSELHGELGRLAGLTDPAQIDWHARLEWSERDECKQLVDYGVLFGRHHGYGEEVQNAYEGIKANLGFLTAKATEASCFFLLWGSLSGNTINAFLFETIAKGEKREGSNRVFEFLFSFWYGGLFLIIKGTSMLLRCLPEVPAVVSLIISLVLALVAFSWIFPYSFVSLLICLPLGIPLTVPVYLPLDAPSEHTSLFGFVTA